MWRKKRSPKPKQKKAKQPTTLQNVSPVLHDTHEKVPVPVSISEEMIGDNRESDKRTELNKEDEEMSISKDLAEEVDKINEQVSMARVKVFRIIPEVRNLRLESQPQNSKLRIF